MPHRVFKGFGSSRSPSPWYGMESALALTLSRFHVRHRRQVEIDIRW